ncbi:MAG: hypothetical protein L0Z53_09520 [Acidobacteriales bacterium]|nr:hypothetical protein [Terriglobales bacterium]
MRIDIPAPRSWFLVLFLAAWLIGWWFGLISVFQQLRKTGLVGNLFQLGWLMFWTFFGLAAIYQVLWTSTGKDVVVVDGIFLSLHKNVLGVNWRSRQFHLQEVQNLRFIPETGSGKQHRASRIGFDYGSKVLDFGEGVNEVEAEQILALIRNRTAVRRSI